VQEKLVRFIADAPQFCTSAVRNSVDGLKSCLKNSRGGMDARRTERRNRNVQKVHEDFEYRATPQAPSAAIF
jgi:hypothetical protein